MWKIRVNRKLLTNLLFISAILFNVQLVNTQIINGNNSLETYLPDLIPNEDATINTNQTSYINTINPKEEEDEILQTPKSTTQIQEDQTHIFINDPTSPTLDITEETTNPIEYNIKHEISNPPAIIAKESQITESSQTTESSYPQLLSIDDAAMFVPQEMAKVQKCCPTGQIVILGQPGAQSSCQESDEVLTIPVFYTNSTHYWNYTTTASSNVDIVFNDPCKESKFFLDPTDKNDIFRLFSNSSLYLPYSMDMLNTDQYCVDTIQGSDTTFTTAIICTASPKMDILQILYIAGLLTSILSLILLAIYSSQRKDLKDDRKKCLATFAGTMATAFICVTIEKIINSFFYNNFNLILAYLIYYLNLNYYLWLNMLSCDIYRFVRGSNDNSVSYMKWYRIITYLTPLVFMLISFSDGFNPSLPSTYLQHRYPSNLLFIIFLYIVPVVISTIWNIIIITICCFALPKERYNNLKDFIATLQSTNWTAPPRNIGEIKQMYRRTLALFVAIMVIFILDIVIYFLPSTGKQQPHFIIRDLVYCLQGLFISLIFVKKNWFCKNFGRHNAAANETELMPMTNVTV